MIELIAWNNLIKAVINHMNVAAVAGLMQKTRNVTGIGTTKNTQTITTFLH